MAFALAGSVITQTGTDTTLSSLSGVSGVTIQSVGNKTVYRIDGHQLQISGTLTFDARTQCIEMINSTVSPVVMVNSTGYLTINSLLNSKPTYDDAIIIRPLPATVNVEFQVNTGGRFYLNGGRLALSGLGTSGYQTLILQKGAIVNITDGWIKAPSNQSRWGEGGTGDLSLYNINRLIVEQIYFTVLGSMANLQGLALFNSSISVAGVVGFTLKDYNPINGSTIDNWSNTNLYVDNAISTNIGLTGGNSGLGFNRWITMRKQIIVSAFSTSNTAILNAVSYIRDTNNGARTDVLNIPNQLNDNIYIQTTNSSGVTPTFSVTLLHGKTTTGVSAALNKDYRTKTTVAGEDLFDIHVLAYGNQYTLLSNVALKGVGVLTTPAIMLTDSNVTLTEANATTKLASSFNVNTGTNTITVTANSSLDDLYDVMKVYKTRNMQAQLEYPTINTQPIVANGNNLTTAMNIIVNNGVTLSSGTKFTSFTTSGNVTNNGSISPVYTDSTGTRVIIKSSNGINLSTTVIVNGTTNLGLVTDVAERYIFVQPLDVVKIYALGYGYQQQLFEITGNVASDYILTLLPNPYVDTGLSTVIRDEISSHLAFGNEGQNFYSSVDIDLRNYTPQEVSNACNHHAYLNSGVLGTAIITNGVVGGDLPIELGDGKLIINSPNFYLKVADSVTTVDNMGMYIPYYIDVNPSVYVTDPTYTPVRKNSSNILLSTALWTKQSADITASDKADIRNGLALETSVQTRASFDNLQEVKRNTDLLPALL